MNVRLWWPTTYAPPMALRPVRTLLRDHPAIIDGAAAAALAMLALAERWTDQDPGIRNADAIATLAILALSGSVAVRRIHPVLATVLAVAGSALGPLAGEPDLGPPILICPITLYAVAANHPDQRLAREVIVVVALCGLLGGTIHDQLSDQVPSIIAFALVAMTALSMVENAAGRRRSLDTAQNRADWLERHRSLDTAAILHEERTRVARELHDVVAHAVPAMIVQADDARSQADHDSASVKQALGNIELLGRRGTDELRRMLGVLRADIPGTDG